MFNKKLKKEINSLKSKIKSLEDEKDIEYNLRLVALNEMRTSKLNHKVCVERIKELNAENARLAGIVGEYQQDLTRNTEKLQSAILENEELKKKIQKYYEYERQFRKKIKDLTEENESLRIQNQLLKALI